MSLIQIDPRYSPSFQNSHPPSKRIKIRKIIYRDNILVPGETLDIIFIINKLNINDINISFIINKKSL